MGHPVQCCTFDERLVELILHFARLQLVSKDCLVTKDHCFGQTPPTLPCHHELEAYLDAYMTAAGVDSEKGTPLFRTAQGKRGRLTERRFDRQSAWYMVKRTGYRSRYPLPYRLSYLLCYRNYSVPFKRRQS
jgi:hypothetical protein